jgi:hypothetical protein
LQSCGNIGRFANDAITQALFANSHFADHDRASVDTAAGFETGCPKLCQSGHDVEAGLDCTLSGVLVGRWRQSPILGGDYRPTRCENRGVGTATTATAGWQWACWRTRLRRQRCPLLSYLPTRPRLLRSSGRNAWSGEMVATSFTKSPRTLGFCWRLDLYQVEVVHHTLVLADRPVCGVSVPRSFKNARFVSRGVQFLEVT